LQLPRWKQDEIIIDGLTRRVQQLVEDMDSMKRMHFEDMRDLKNERDDLRAETERQQRTIAKMERKIDRLLGRKSELKAGTALLASQKENLLAEKAALREELLLTRSQRDGYLTDRKVCSCIPGVDEGGASLHLICH
jgi:chromosome segregation ATPase